MHHLHEGTTRLTHSTAHLFHEKAFWGIVVFFAVLGAVIAALTLLGNNTEIPDYQFMHPYGFH
jgi:hypothetical protein